MTRFRRWWRKPFGPADKILFWQLAAESEWDEFLMWFDEHVRRRCGVCRLKNGSGHKMDCHREYVKEVYGG